MMRPRMRRTVAVAMSLGAALVLATGCGVTRGEQSRDLTMLIPNSAGGGYDQTGRAAVAVMENGDITGGSFEVTNVIGAGGSVAMTRLMNAEGDERTMMTAGLGVVGSLYSFGVPYKLQDATPLAQLIEDQEGVLVPADSPFETIDDLVEAWQDDPDSIVAGGPLTSALLGNKIDVGFSGVGEFAGALSSGELRLLAVSGEERLKGEGISDAPTLTEAGIDLVFTNWRGVFAPPGISDERRDEMIALLEEMHDTPEWQQALEDYGWIDEFKTGDEFTTFLQEQDERVATTLEELDLL
jgi:putative tricarboxylic transport membrane protein